MKFPHNISRIEAFSDAVFAFAATLLVVDLGNTEATSTLNIDIVSFIGFAISFFVLATLWYLHYNFFRRTNYMDNWIIGINTVLLFVVLYYVFPLKSLINSWFQVDGMSITKLADIFMLYGLGFALIFLCLSLMYRRASKKEKEIDVIITSTFYMRHFAIFTFVAILSIGVAYSKIGLNFGFPGIIYGLLGPLCSIHSHLFYKKYQNL